MICQNHFGLTCSLESLRQSVPFRSSTFFLKAPATSGRGGSLSVRRAGPAGAAAVPGLTGGGWGGAAPAPGLAGAAAGTGAGAAGRGLDFEALASPTVPPEAGAGAVGRCDNDVSSSESRAPSAASAARFSILAVGALCSEGMLGAEETIVPRSAIAFCSSM